ncbi:MAG TPA: hypothetical protein VLT57_08330 [Bryobacteraceae bacterium]|nr:hypothetical protein [Bryobacteraceae bacterium]
MILLASFFLLLPVCEEPPARALPARTAAAAKAVPEESPEAETQAELAGVRRIYVDILTGGEAALKFRDMIISSLEQSKAFLITENQDKADAILKGAADDQVFTDRHETSDGLTAHANLGKSSGWHSRFTGSNSSESSGLGVGEHESSRVEERQHEAFAALRLVNPDGDVIWSSTQESVGGKFTGASADVADRVARQLVEDYRRAKRGTAH